MEEQENTDPFDAVPQTHLESAYAMKNRASYMQHVDDHDSTRAPPESSSLHFSEGFDASNLHSEGSTSLDEREMRRHLNDVESSFLPENAAEDIVEEEIGADDTYVNLRSSDQVPDLRELMGLPRRSPSAFGGAYDQDHGENDSTAEGQAISENHTGKSDGRNSRATSTPTFEIDPSSPAAAAAERSTSRGTSQGSARSGAALKAVADSIPSRSSSKLHASRPTPLKRPSSSNASITSSRSSRDAGRSTEALSATSTRKSAEGGRIQQRPTTLHNRQVSHLSTASSQGAYSEVSGGSDITINADYALQTGGAVPSNSPLASRPHKALSRLPSLGSVASDMSRDSDNGMPSFNRGISGLSTLGSLRASNRLDRLEEERNSVASSPVTPRPPTSHFPGITDTAIAQHVQNIMVPDTIAREYRQQHRSQSPDKRPTSNSSTFTARPQSTLTLKEQNSKIDRLTKENFDLKLKIHFLDQALQNRSDEGVKDMINKNVQFQTDLANERKEHQSLRRRIRDMERRIKDLEDELADAQERSAEAHLNSHEDMEIEIQELKEQLDRYQVRITKLSAESLAKEVEKRKMAEYMAAMTDRKGSEQNAAEEEAEMWKDLLTTESSRREQAEDDVRKLREELIILRSEKAAKEKATDRSVKRGSRYVGSVSGGSETFDDRSGAVTGSSVTMVEQLRHENLELRRDLGAQTSMLTSRNKERERLQQEIEDLKLVQRKGDGARSLAGDSIFERSASRAQQRSPSRASGHAGYSQVSQAEREEFEQREGMLRDQNAQIRLEYQDLEKEAQARMDYITQLEDDLKTTEGEFNAALGDLKALQKERDDALKALEYRDAEYERLSDEYKKLEDEALMNIDGLEDSLAHSEQSREQLVAEVKRKTEDFSALQHELRSLGTKLIQLEDDREASLKRIEVLEAELDDANQELETLDKKLREAHQKHQRLEIQHESLHSEISFLREEQESDKIKIGDLENNLNAAQQAVHDERERMQELETSLTEERKQREIVDSQSKREVQKVISDLNAENAKFRDELRTLRRSLTSAETEASTYKGRLEDLESGLRRTLGDLDGTRASLLQDIEDMQMDLEKTVQQLDEARADIDDKDRLIKSRDVLLESTGLESRRLSDLLDKERQGRKHDQHQFDLSQRGNSTHLRAIAQHETKALELETARTQDKRKAALLEQQYRDQLLERNNLLLSLWNRLSTLAGTEWAQSHRLTNGQVTNAEAIAKSLPAFNENIIDAIKQIEVLVGGFKNRIRTVEKRLEKDYEILAQNMDARVQRMDYLERAVEEAQAAIEAQRAEEANTLRPTTSRSSSNSRLTKINSEELNKLRQENKNLQAELKFQRQHPSQPNPERFAQEAAVAANARRQSGVGSSSFVGKVGSSLSPRALASSLLRHHSTSAVETLQAGSQEGRPASASGSRQPVVLSTPPLQPSEQRLVHRLREMERRLKAEREARLLDRRGARQRLDERSAENEELKAKLERETERRMSMVSLQDAEREENEGDETPRPRTAIDSRDNRRRREASLD